MIVYNDNMSAASVDLESLFKESAGVPVGARPPRMRYSHEAMADLLIQNPWISQNQIAAHFGYTASWVSTIITSDAFQALLASRREEVVDPILRASLEERFRGLVHRSLEVLAEKLDKPAASIPDNVVLRALELGARGIELGGFGRPQVAPPSAPEPKRLERLANRLVELQANVRKGITYENETEVFEIPKGSGNGKVCGSESNGGESAEGTVRAKGPEPGTPAREDGGAAMSFPAAGAAVERVGGL